MGIIGQLDPRAFRAFMGAFIFLCFGFFSSDASAQALAVETLEGGTEVILVTEPLAEASAACWPRANEVLEAHCVMGSELVFLGELEKEIVEGDAPPVVVVVGGVGRSALIDLLRRTLRDRLLSPLDERRTNAFEEGGQERRLGTLGAPSTLRLEVPLPPPESAQRSAIEVLWHLLPRYFRVEHPGLRSGIVGDVGHVETSVDPELADVTLRKLRLSLARLAGDPALIGSEVENEARRLRIGRQAELERVEPATRQLLDLWRRGGADAVRHHLFGPDGVTVLSVREAARGWLPSHPGHAVLVLPPRVFRPRFAPGPLEVRLDNDLAVAVLERPTASLSALVMRPVLLSGLAGDVEAVILARVAAALRTQETRPPFIKVEVHPPRLELATSSDDFASLTEALQEALEVVANDHQEVTSSETARARALRLMAGVFGLDSSSVVSPAGVLASENLVIGAVTPDAEAAVEALRKFGVGGTSSGAPRLSASLVDQARRRLPAAGRKAAVAAAIYFEEGFPIPEMVAQIVNQRAETVLEGARVDILHPLLPGRTVFVMLVEREGSIDELETLLEQSWSDLFSLTTEDEVQGVRRKVAASVISTASGVMGRARACAQVAAGEDSWREPAKAEMTVLTVELEAVNATLTRILQTETMERTSSGPLPVILSSE
ncbi:MAG: hypothetical protein K8R59_11720 [Thermoanaerobaculales bacterium]|nr:hypothetical protein [Thermoanaerobaculales bacterium]